MKCINLKILNIYCTVMGYLNTGIVAQQDIDWHVQLIIR